MKRITLPALFSLFVLFVQCTKSPNENVVNPTDYPLHQNITVTVFWVGEEASEENDSIANLQSAWDDQWMAHYGGVDNPDERNGYNPAGFLPAENPFYFALPYNDFDENGERKTRAAQTVYWSDEQEWKALESMCKNRWIEITKNNKTAYAQWEDVGPFEENDKQYVFGTSSPKNKINNHAGLDVSPAVRDYLNLSGIDKISWQFVNFDEVPDGPWKEKVSTSQIYWE